MSEAGARMRHELTVLHTHVEGARLRMCWLSGRVLASLGGFALRHC